MNDLLTRYLEYKRSLDAFSSRERGYLDTRESAAKGYIEMRSICQTQLPRFVMEANEIGLEDFLALFEGQEEMYVEEHTCIKEIYALIQNPSAEIRSAYEFFRNSIKVV